jgi:hypothetical protein
MRENELLLGCRRPSSTHHPPRHLSPPPPRGTSSSRLAAKRSQHPTAHRPLARRTMGSKNCVDQREREGFPTQAQGTDRMSREATKGRQTRVSRAVLSRDSRPTSRDRLDRRLEWIQCPTLRSSTPLMRMKMRSRTISRRPRSPSTLWVSQSSTRPPHSKAPSRWTRPKPLPKRISFKPSPYHYVVTPDLTRATNSPVSQLSSPRTPRDSPPTSARPSPKASQSPHLVDVSFRSPVIKQTTSYTDVFSSIMTPGSTTIYCAESPALSSDGFGEGPNSIELSDSPRISKSKAESADILPVRPVVSTPKFADQERTVRQWSSQNSGNWVRRSSVYSNSGKQEHNAWPGSRNSGILSV